MLRMFFGCVFVCAQTIAAAPGSDPTAGAVNALGLDLLRGRPAGANAVLSPYSVDLALAMAWEGARGETKTQMGRALNYPDTGDAAPFASLSREMAASLLDEPGDGKNPPVRLDIACRLFGQKDFAFRPAYLKLVQENYGAALAAVDFAKNPAAAAKTINTWVEKQTQDRIRDLVSASALPPATRLVLVNAIYFKAAWEHKFEKAFTKPRSFHLADGKSIAVPTMMHLTSFGYRKGEGYTAVCLPYVTEDLAFLIVLPDDPSGLSKLERELDAKTLTSFSLLERQPGIIQLPKFKLEPPALSLSAALQKLGMECAFDIPHGSADFDGIAPAHSDERLYISDVIHKAFISVDEQGTEAAAATAVVMLAGAAPDMRKPVEVRVDHPFLFAIQHRASGACLFLGRVVDPR